MWKVAYETKNLQAMQNPFTVGQCGGMCAVWLANMYNRAKKSLDETKPNTRVAIDTHLAGLHVKPAHYVEEETTSGRRLKPNMAALPGYDSNMRYVAAAGLKPGPVKLSYSWIELGNWLAQVAAKGGYFIDVGGHAVATFVTHTQLAPFEKKRRLYYFDPQHGCFFSEDELSFRVKFAELVNEHTGRNHLYNDVCWACFKVFNEASIRDDDADIDISPLFA